MRSPPSLLVNCVEGRGRPAAVYVRSGWLGSLLRSACKAAGVQPVESEGIPVTDGLLDQLMGAFMAGFSMNEDLGGLK